MRPAIIVAVVLYRAVLHVTVHQLHASQPNKPATLEKTLTLMLLTPCDMYPVQNGHCAAIIGRFDVSTAEAFYRDFGLPFRI